MSELSEAEKRKILRERRAAKFAKGGAGSRLNKIVNENDSSLNISSPLENVPQPSFSNTNKESSADPEIADIGEIVDPLNGQSLVKGRTDMDQDIDKMFSSIFQNAPQSAASDPFQDELLKNLLGGASSNADNPFLDGASPNGSSDPFNILSQLMGGDSTNGGDSPAGSYGEDLQEKLVFQKYQTDKLNFRFLMVRFISIGIMLFHTIVNQGVFSSSYEYIREQTLHIDQSFYTYFLTFEFLVLSTYFILVTKKGDAHYEDSKIVQLLKMASLIPIVNSYRPMIMKYVKYQQLIMMFVKDLAFVVLVFGLISFLH